MGPTSHGRFYFSAPKGRLAMPSTYPFDSSDWTTITPLFEALIAAPVADGGFMDWLEQWNRLDIAVWDAYTVLKRRAYSGTAISPPSRFMRRMCKTLFNRSKANQPDQETVIMSSLFVRSSQPPNGWVMHYFTRQWKPMVMLALFLC